MTAQRVPLGVLDLVPISAGSSPRTAVLHAVDLAQRAEEFGYRRYWFAEHHLNPGIAGTSPPVMIALVASATREIRLGSGGVQSGHRTALAIVEEFGLLDAAYPGRIDLGMGRSGGRNFVRNRQAPPSTAPTVPGKPGETGRHYTSNGLLIPAPPPPVDRSSRPPRTRLGAELLQQPAAESPSYTDLVNNVLGLLSGSFRSLDGLDPHPVPGQGAKVEPWLLGSSAGESATVAGQHGLRFAANYHVSPATVLQAVDAYRAAFVPSEDLDRPYVAVSADVVVGSDDQSAQQLAAGFLPWVYSIRSGEGAIEFPTTEQAARCRWSDEALALVADRIETQFVGSPATVAANLECLQQATGADELFVTTITHRHTDRVRSYELLAKEWFS